MTWYFDVPNLLVCIIAVIIAWRVKIIPDWIAILLVIYSFMPFFLNDFLFPSRYMKDQYIYTRALEEVRSLNFMPQWIMEHDRDGAAKKILLPAWFLSALPIPFVETIKSIGFFNRFLFLILFLWLYSKKFLTGMPLLFYLFYPSLLLYSSLSLKDPLVLSFMTIGTIFLIEQKYIKFIIIISPLLLMKFQTFFFMIILFGIFLIFKKRLTYKINYLLIGLVIFCSFLFIDDIIHALNHYRVGFWVENNKISHNTFDLVGYYPLDKSFSLIAHSFFAFFSFLLMPLPWEASNFLQRIQSIENIFVVFSLIVFIKKAYNQNVLVATKWILFLVTTFTIHGLVVFNEGTAARFRYPFIVIFVIGLAYELYKVNGYRFGGILKKK